MRKLLVLSFLALVFAETAGGQEIYQYTDKDGIIHFTDDISKVPKGQRVPVERYRQNPRPSEPESPQEGESVESRGPIYVPRSDKDKMYLKAMRELGNDRLLRALDEGVTYEEFEGVKKLIEREYGINDQNIRKFVATDQRFSSPEVTWEIYKRGSPKR
jgi:hypothetical protein